MKDEERKKEKKYIMQKLYLVRYLDLMKVIALRWCESETMTNIRLRL